MTKFEATLQVTKVILMIYALWWAFNKLSCLCK